MDHARYTHQARITQFVVHLHHVVVLPLNHYSVHDDGNDKHHTVVIQSKARARLMMVAARYPNCVMFKIHISNHKINHFFTFKADSFSLLCIYSCNPFLGWEITSLTSFSQHYYRCCFFYFFLARIQHEIDSPTTHGMLN